MKRIITLLFFLNVCFLFCQTPCESYCLSFEDTFCLNQLTIDTAKSSKNLWQIGSPQKTQFNKAESGQNVIITDLTKSYPINNYSDFIITHLSALGDVYGFRMLQGYYNVQTDSLRDYGSMEFSPDNGKKWIDIINDTVYNAFVWYSKKPVLTGNSHGWKYFDVSLADIGSVFNLQLGDTLLFRFGFKSDSISNNLAGLMYDNICFKGFVEGISKTHFKPIKSKIYPNPSVNNFLIEFENSTGELYELSVYDIHSKLLMKEENITDSKIIVNVKSFRPGIYVYKLTNLKAQKRSWGKFILSE